MVIISLVILGLSLGSFVNALVWRLEQQASKAKPQENISLTRGRSMCVHCKHTLAWYDLMPVLSWLSLSGKCRYCAKKISTQYPLVELLTAATFVVSYVFWSAELAGLEWLKFGFWLALLVVLIALAIYDLQTMLLPNKLVFAAGVIVLVAFTTQLVIEPSISYLVNVAFGVVSFGGLFYALFQVSNGRWIGGGDVKLGFVLGAWLASPALGFMAIFIASLIGSAFAAIAALAGRMTLTTKVPFGPMLIAGTFIATLFGQQLLNAYLRILTGY